MKRRLKSGFLPNCGEDVWQKRHMKTSIGNDFVMKMNFSLTSTYRDIFPTKLTSNAIHDFDPAHTIRATRDQRSKLNKGGQT